MHAENSTGARVLKSMFELTECSGCPFGGPKVAGKGDPNSPFLIIGESPGKQELVKGEPFVGPSGKVLDTALAQVVGIPEPYIINAMQCFPGIAAMKNEDNLQAGVAACRHHLLKEINRAPRKVILALGAPALWAVTNNYSYRITKERGKLIPTEHAEMGLIASVHPAFLMRGGAGATFQQFMRDVKYAEELALGFPPKSPPKVEYIIARDERDIRDMSAHFASLPEGTVIGGDLETSGFSPLKDRILSAGFGYKAEEIYCFPESLCEGLEPLFHPHLRYLWHNGKFDIRFLWENGAPSARVDEDTMLLSYVLDENGGIHDLETVSSDWLNSPNWKEMLESHLNKRTDSYEVIPKDVLHHYMALDIGNTIASFHVLRSVVAADPALNRAYTRLLIPASNTLARVERNGLFVDKERVAENTEWYKDEIEKYRKEFMRFAEPFPDSGYTEKLINSPKQMKQLLYSDLKIKPFKGRMTTDKKVLEKLPKHPAIETLFKARKVVKEYGTYVKNVEDNIDIDGAVHCTYKLHGTKTGRLASANPNLQNIPRNPRIRGQYIAREGRRFIEPDLSQAELRVLACLSNDPVLCHIYETAGMSLHDEVRADIWGYAKDWSESVVREHLRKFGLTEDTRWGAKGEDRILEEQKMRAKAVNFGIVYGRTAQSISEEFSITIKEAQHWIDKWFKKFPKATEFLMRCREVPVKGQILVTPFGRKRRFGVVGNERIDMMQNEASNFPMQGPASDITLDTARRIEFTIKEQFDADICNLVHDSILIELPDDDNIARECAIFVIKALEETPKLWGFKRIPFVAEAKMGTRWGSLSKYDPFKEAA